MWHQMYKMKCEDKSNIHMHLVDSMKIQEQLLGINAALTDDDFITVIFGSLPQSYCHLINVIMVSMAQQLGWQHSLIFTYCHNNSVAIDYH